MLSHLKRAVRLASRTVRPVGVWMRHRLGIREVRGHTFYAGQLGASSLVVDLGACHGDFSVAVTSRYGCRAIAVEPSPELFETIPESPSIERHNLAIAGRAGTATFHVSTLDTAGTIVGPKPNSSGRRVSVPTRTLAEFLDTEAPGEIDLLKVDIEGSEIEAFEGLPSGALARVKQLSVEFHDSVRYPNVTTEDVERTIDSIVALGFEAYRMGSANIDWLFVALDRLHLPLPTRIYLGRSRRKAASGRAGAGGGAP